MSVSSHLRIDLAEYDARIGTFIPGYEQMLECAARAVRVLEVPAPVIVDLGTGTGALASRCLDQVPAARIVAVDADAEMLDLARQRIISKGVTTASFVQSSFLDLRWPSCDAVVASLALHHVRTVERKQQLYSDIRTALRPHGLFVTADCCPSSHARLAAIELEAWRTHLRTTYSESEMQAFFTTWAEEDTYVPLEEELALMRSAGFAPEVIWRLAPMAVIAAMPK